MKIHSDKSIVVRYVCIGEGCVQIGQIGPITCFFVSHERSAVIKV